MFEARFTLCISAEEYLRFYRGSARFVQVTASDGRRLKFPAANLRPFVTREGIRGLFLIRFDDDYRLQSLKKIG